jgi:hypothetical protein
MKPTATTRRPRGLASAALALLLLASACLATLAAAAADVLGGQDAAAALGAAAAAAASTGSGSAAAAASSSDDFISSLSASALAGWQSALLRDQDLKYVPAAKQLIYACSGLHESHAHGGPGDAAGAGPALVAAAAADDTVAPALAVGDPSSFAYPNEADPSTANAFKLHSRPNAAKKIVLDFTGHTLRAGTSWGPLNNNGDVPIVTPPWSLDTNPAFSATELRAIVSIWRNVAEDYANWDVDVTTEEPAGTDDEADAWLVGRGVRVAIGDDNGWFGPYGGVAFVNGFGRASAGPVAYVFNPSPVGVARAATHEVGHTLGLQHHGNVAHDNVARSEYYMGHNQWCEWLVVVVLWGLYV